MFAIDGVKLPAMRRSIEAARAPLMSALPNCARTYAKPSVKCVMTPACIDALSNFAIAACPRGSTGAEGRPYAIGVYRYAHEHLGQLIAHARVNGVKPPWIK